MSGAGRTRGAARADEAPRHRERLWPSPAAWALPVLAAAFTGVALLPVDAALAALGAAAAAAVAVALLVRASAVVEVDASGALRAGRAVLPGRWVTGAEAARGERARALKGVELDARTHLLLRGWVEPVVLVHLGDPVDPTPSWLVSTRAPERLVEALGGAARDQRS